MMHDLLEAFFTFTGCPFSTGIRMSPVFTIENNKTRARIFLHPIPPVVSFRVFSLSFLLPSPRSSSFRFHVCTWWNSYRFEIFPNDLLFERENRLRFHAYVDSILKIYKSRSAQHRGGILYGGPWVCKLRRNFHSVMATRRYGPLPVQRVRSLPQDEWNESTFGEAATAIGKEGRKKIRKEGRKERNN